VLLLTLLRIVNSPFGRVLQAIRENEFRAEAIGYRVVVYRTISSVLSALFACLAGAMLALWLRYNGPDTSMSFEIMMDVLLIVVIGGMGTIYGAAIGAALFMVAQGYLQDLLQAGQRGGERPALVVGAVVARPLAVVAGRVVRVVGLLLSRPVWWGGCGPVQHRRRTGKGEHAGNFPLHPVRRARAPLHGLGCRQPAHRDRLAWVGTHRP
jgi:ABC-type branched-subunit amino acid transport system permease subunit